jgi:hypothetical protein
MTDPRGYTYHNEPPPTGGYHPPPTNPGEGWRELLPEETITPGDEFWATARGHWVQILEPTCFGKPAAYITDGMETKCRRLVDPLSLDEETERKEVSV